MENHIRKPGLFFQVQKFLFNDPVFARSAVWQSDDKVVILIFVTEKIS